MKIHSGKKLYSCEVCEKSFTKQCNLHAHLRTHTGEGLFYCKVCQKSFPIMSALRKHEKVHAGIKPYFCETCKKSFSRKDCLKVHMIIHTGEKPFRCEVCLQSFARSIYLKYHEKTHTGEKPFRCEVCMQSFARSCNLKQHEKTHTGEKPYYCNVRQKSFAEYCDLQNQERLHTRDQPCILVAYNKPFFPPSGLLQLSSLESRASETHYFSDVCKKLYTEYSSLQWHVITPTCAEPYCCKVCTKTFRLEEDLQHHVNVQHLGETSMVNAVSQTSFMDAALLDRAQIVLKKNCIQRNEHNQLTVHESVHPMSNHRNGFSSFDMDGFCTSDVKAYGCGVCNDLFDNKIIFLKHCDDHGYDLTCLNYIFDV